MTFKNLNSFYFYFQKKTTTNRNEIKLKFHLKKNDINDYKIFNKIHKKLNNYKHKIEFLFSQIKFYD